MPRQPIIDYKRYYVFNYGKAFCVIPGCTRPDWGYSLTGSNTKSMLKHLRDKHPVEYEQGIALQAAALAQEDAPPADSAPVDNAADEPAKAVSSMSFSLDFSSADEQPSLPVKVSSTDEQPGLSKPRTTSINLPEVRSTAPAWSLFSDKLKEKLEKLSASLAAPAYSPSPGHSGRRLSTERAGSASPEMDVGDAVVPQVQPPTASPDDEEEADSSSDDEERPNNGTGAGQNRYAVQKILRKRVVNGEVFLLTKWAGYSRADWQPLANFDRTNAALMEFELRNASTAAESTDEDDDVHAKGIGECKGFASVVYRCTVEFESAKEEPYTFMMKVPTTQFFKEFLFTDKDGELTADPIRPIVDGHNGECAFYEHFSAENVVPTPQVWYTRKMTGEVGVTGVIIMDDLSRLGCSPSLATSASMQQIKNITTHLAALHAYTLCNDVQRLPIGNFYHVEQWEADLFWRSIEDLLEYDETLKPLVEKFKHVATPEFARYALLERPKELGLPSVLCHGDLWVNNLLFKRAPDGTASNDILAFLDWQNVFYGNPTFDLARYLAFCADAEVRREAEVFVFDFYLGELNRRMALKNRKPDFDAAQLKTAYLLAQIQQATEAIPMVPFANNLVPTDNEAVQKAIKAKLALRSRLLMEDAIEAMEEVAKGFLSKNA